MLLATTFLSCEVKGMLAEQECMLFSHMTHFSNEALYRGLEEICGWTRVPLPIPFGEVLGYDVTGNTCESNVALSPLLETKVKPVVLDPLNTSDAILIACQLFHLNFAVQTMNLFYAQLSLCHQDGWRPPLRSKASLLRTAPSFCRRVVTSIEIIIEQWRQGRNVTKLARESALNKVGASHWS